MPHRGAGGSFDWVLVRADERGGVIRDLEPIYAIPLAAVIVSGATLLMTAIALRTKASVEELVALRVQIADLKLELVACRGESVQLHGENLQLMRRLLRLETASPNA